MNIDMRKWINVADGEHNFKSDAVNEDTQSRACECRLYTCYECFPDNFIEQAEPRSYDNAYTTGDIVEIAALAGGGNGVVAECKGNFVKVRRADGNQMMVHLSDVRLVESDPHDQSVAFASDFFTGAPEDDDDNSSDLELSFGNVDSSVDYNTVNPDSDDDFLSMIEDILRWQDEGSVDTDYDSNFLQGLTMKGLARIHLNLAKASRENMFDENTITEYHDDDTEVEPHERERFEQYCRLCDEQGVKKLRSKFLSAPPEIQQRAIDYLKQPRYYDTFSPPHPLKAAELDQSHADHRRNPSWG
jgi:hypothetical protein